MAHTDILQFVSKQATEGMEGRRLAKAPWAAGGSGRPRPLLARSLMSLFKIAHSDQMTLKIHNSSV